MASTRARRQRRIAVIIALVYLFGRVGVALISAGLTTMSPTPHADPQLDTFKQTCAADPWSYALGAARGVYHEQAVAGGEVDQICSLYGPPAPSFPDGRWLRDSTRRNCPQPQSGPPVDTPPSPPTTGGAGASLAIPMAAK